MAHKMLRSHFLGQTLERSTQPKATSVPVQQTTQALFGNKGKNKGKQAAGGAKGIFQKAKGATKQAQKQASKSAPSAPKRAGSPAKKQGSKAAKASKGWLGGAGGAENLDKFYGVFLRPCIRTRRLIRSDAVHDVCPVLSITSCISMLYDSSVYGVQAPTVSCFCPEVCWIAQTFQHT